MEDSAFRNYTAFIQEFTTSLSPAASSDYHHGFAVYGGDAFGENLSIGDFLAPTPLVANFITALDAAQPVGGPAGHNTAVVFAEQLLLTHARNTSTRVVILLADHPAEDFMGNPLISETEQTIAALKQSTGANFLLVRVGLDWDPAEFVYSNADQVHDVQSAMDLPSLLPDYLCISPPPITSVPTSSPVCPIPEPLDLFWVVQSSTSMDPFFPSIMGEIAAFTQTHLLGTSDSQVGFLEFAGPNLAEGLLATFRHQLALSTNVAGFLSQVRDVIVPDGVMGGSTDLVAALNKLREDSLIPSRPGAFPVVVLVLATLPSNESGDYLAQADAGLVHDAIASLKAVNPGLVLVLLRLSFAEDETWFLQAEADFKYDLDFPLDATAAALEELRFLCVPLTHAPTTSPTMPTSAPSSAPVFVPSTAPTASPLPATAAPITATPTIATAAPVSTQAPAPEPTPGPTAAQCARDAMMDIVWVVQSSNAVDANELGNVTNFIDAFIQNSAQTTTRHAFLQYAGPSFADTNVPVVGASFPLEYAAALDFPTFASGLEPMVGGVNNAPAALNHVRTNMLTLGNVRAGAARIVVLFLFSDPSEFSGASTSAMRANTESEVELLQSEDGATVIVISLDQGPEPGFPAGADKLYAVFLHELPALLPEFLCLTDAPTAAPTTRVCNPLSEADIVWLIDGSQNTMDDDAMFQQYLYFAKNATKALVGSRQGFVVYGGETFDPASPVLGDNLALTADKEAFEQALLAATPVGGATSHHVAIDFAKQMFAASTPSSTKLIILLADSIARDANGASLATLANTAIEQLSSDGIQLVLVTIVPDQVDKFTYAAVQEKYDVDTPLQLDTLLTDTQFLCAKDTSSPTQAPTCVNNSPLDLFWLVQSSTGMQPYFPNLMREIANFSQAQSSASNRFGFLEFAGPNAAEGISTTLGQEIPLTADSQDFLASISGKTSAMGGSSNLTAAFQRLVEANLVPPRAGAFQVVVLVMSSLPTNSEGVYITQADGASIVEAAVTRFKDTHPGVLLFFIRLDYDDADKWFLQTQTDSFFDSGFPLDSFANTLQPLCEEQLSFRPTQSPTTFSPTASPSKTPSALPTALPSKTPTTSPILSTHAPSTSPSFTTLPPGNTPPANCWRNDNADYVFAVQASSSVVPEHFAVAKDFIGTFLRQTVTERTRFAYLDFSGTNTNTLGLGAVATPTQYSAEVQAFTTRAGTNSAATNVDSITDAILTSSNLRAGVERVVVLFLFSDPSDAAGNPDSFALEQAVARLKAEHDATVLLVAPNDLVDPALLSTQADHIYRYPYGALAAVYSDFACFTRAPTLPAATLVPTTLPTAVTLAPTTLSPVSTLAPTFATAQPSLAPTRYVLNNRDRDEWRRFRSAFPDETFCPSNVADPCNACGENNSTERYVVCDLLSTTGNFAGRRQLGVTIELRISKIKLRNSQLVGTLRTPAFTQLDELDLTNEECGPTLNYITMETTSVCSNIRTCLIDLTVKDCNDFPWWIIILLLLLLCCCCCVLLFFLWRRREKREKKKEEKERDEFYKDKDLEDGDYDPVFDKKSETVPKRTSSLGGKVKSFVSGALAGGKSPTKRELRDGWEEHYDPETKSTYYLNRRTGESQWTNPNLDVDVDGEDEVWVKKYHDASGTSYYMNQKTGETSMAKPHDGTAGGGNASVFDSFPTAFSGMSRIGDTLRRKTLGGKKAGEDAPGEEEEEEGPVSSRRSVTFGDEDQDLGEYSVVGGAGARRGSTIPGVKSKPLGRFNRQKRSDTLDDDTFGEAMNPLFGMGGHGGHEDRRSGASPSPDRGMVSMNPAFEHGDVAEFSEDETGMEPMFGTPLAAHQRPSQSRKQRLAAMLPRKKKAAEEDAVQEPDPFAGMSSINPAFAHGDLVEEEEEFNRTAVASRPGSTSSAAASAAKKSSGISSIFGWSRSKEDRSAAQQEAAQMEPQDMFATNPAFQERPPLHAGRARLTGLSFSSNEEEEATLPLVTEQSDAASVESDEEEGSFIEHSTGGNDEEPSAMNPLFAGKVQFANDERVHEQVLPDDGMSEFERQAFLATGAKPLRDMREEDINEESVRRTSMGTSGNGGLSAFIPGILRNKEDRRTSSNSAASGAVDRRASTRRASSRAASTQSIVDVPSAGLFHVQPVAEVAEEDEEELSVFERQKLLRGNNNLAEEDGATQQPPRRSLSAKDFRVVRDSKSALKRLSLARKPKEDETNKRLEKDLGQIGIAGRVQEMRNRIEEKKKPPRKSGVERNIKEQLAKRESERKRLEGELGVQGKVNQVANKFGAPKPTTAAPDAVVAAAAAAAPMASMRHAISHTDEEEVLWIEAEDEATGRPIWVDADTGEFTFIRPETGTFSSEEVLYAAGKDVAPRAEVALEHKVAAKPLAAAAAPPPPPTAAETAWDMLHGNTAAAAAAALRQQAYSSGDDDEEDEEYTAALTNGDEDEEAQHRAHNQQARDRMFGM